MLDAAFAAEAIWRLAGASPTAHGHSGTQHATEHATEHYNTVLQRPRTLKANGEAL